MFSEGGAPASNILPVSWEEVGGMEAAKEEIHQMISLPLKHPQLFNGEQVIAS